MFRLNGHECMKFTDTDASRQPVKGKQMQCIVGFIVAVLAFDVVVFVYYAHTSVLEIAIARLVMSSW